LLTSPGLARPGHQVKLRSVSQSWDQREHLSFQIVSGTVNTTDFEYDRHGSHEAPRDSALISVFGASLRFLHEDRLF
jgi:hypothetical protein